MITTSQAADLFRRVGARNPLEAACGQTPSAKPNKYGARKKVVDGITFGSTAEAKAYMTLKVRQIAGEIRELELQPRLLLQAGFRDETGKWHRKIEYVGDFQYYDVRLERWTIVEVKGFETPTWRLKEKLVRAKRPIIRLEVWKRGVPPQ